MRGILFCVWVCGCFGSLVALASALFAFPSGHKLLRPRACIGKHYHLRGRRCDSHPEPQGRMVCWHRVRFASKRPKLKSQCPHSCVIIQVTCALPLVAQADRSFSGSDSSGEKGAARLVAPPPLLGPCPTRTCPTRTSPSRISPDPTF